MPEQDELSIETVEIADLTLDPHNARSHNEINLKALIHSLNLFGQVRPIVVSSESVVYAGNGLLQAARALAWTHIQIVRMPHWWSEERRMAYALADNRSGELGEWDKPALASQLLELDSMGWEIKELGFDNLAELEVHTRPPAETPPIVEDRSIACPRCGVVLPGKKKGSK